MARILVVEDEPEIAESLVALLRARGHKAEACPDGGLAFERARKLRPDLILLDVLLPRISGIDVCRLLKGDDRTRAAKVVMVTGMGRMGDVEKAFEAGADDYLIKPFDGERLFRKIDKVLAA